MEKIDKLKNELFIYHTVGEDYRRFGSRNDGGYIMVNDISKNDVIISCGIADGDNYRIEDIHFEKEIFDISKDVYMYECCLDGIDNLPENAHFFKGYVGVEIMLSDMLDKINTDDDCILKIDIEGGEWDFFDKATSDEIKRFRQIVVELHWLPEMIDNQFEKIFSVLNKINITHKVVLINANNYGGMKISDNETVPDVIEVLFLRKDDYNFVDVDRPTALIEKCSPNSPAIEAFYR